MLPFFTQKVSSFALGYKFPIFCIETESAVFIVSERERLKVAGPSINSIETESEREEVSYAETLWVSPAAGLNAIV